MCTHLTWGYSPCTRPHGHTGPHIAGFTTRRTP